MLPKGWVETTLGDVIELNYGSALPKQSRMTGDFPVFGSNGVVGHHHEYLVKGPAIIVGRKGSSGAVHTSLTPCHPIDTTYYVDNFDNIYFYFAIYLLKTLELDKLNRATAIPGLNRQDAYQLIIKLPPLAEQRRIVAKLDSLTARIARARAELECAKRLQKQWFSKFLDSEFSCDGELLRLGELAEDVRYGTAQKCDYNPAFTPVLRIPNIARGNIDTSDLKYSTFTEKEIKKLSLCNGDLLIVRSNGSVDLVGQSAVADTQVSGFLFAGYLIRIRLKNKDITPYFVHYWLRSPKARSVINAAAKSTSGVNNINSEQLKNLQIKIPSRSKQRIIVSRIIKAFSRADRLETEAQRALALLDRLESSLLVKAFRGELVPQDPNDEPASVLLDRIRAERAAAPKPKRGRKQSTQGLPLPKKRRTEKHG